MANLTLMLCGPHASRVWSPLYHRIDAAIIVAAETRTPLLVVGDSHGGEAVRHFAERARSRGIADVIEAYDPGGRTLTDARAALRMIGEHPALAAVTGLLVVTDDWHFVRAAQMLAGERERLLPNRRLVLHNRSTDAGPRPPPYVKEGERKGVEDYLAGRPYDPFGEPFGKP